MPLRRGRTRTGGVLHAIETAIQPLHRPSLPGKRQQHASQRPFRPFRAALDGYTTATNALALALLASVVRGSGLIGVGYFSLPPAPESIFTSAQLDVIIEIGDVLASLSLVGCAFIAVSYFLFKHLHSFAFKLILSLAFANVGFNVATLVGTDHGESKFLCMSQGISRVYFSLVQMALVTAIMAICYVMIIRRDYGVRNRLLLINGLCWTVPLVMALLPLTTGSYGWTGAWCSIVSTNLKEFVAGTIWRFLVIYIPLWLSTVANAYLYWRVWRAARGLQQALQAYGDMEDADDGSDDGGDSTPVSSFGGGGDGRATTAAVSPAPSGSTETRGLSAFGFTSVGTGAAGGTEAGGGGGGSSRGGGGGGGGEGGGGGGSIGNGSGSGSSSVGERGERGASGRGGETTLQIINRLRMYPMALMICWSWSSINRVYEVIDPYNTQYWLVILQYTFEYMQGVCNAIIFALTPTVLSSWARLLGDAADRCRASCGCIGIVCCCCHGGVGGSGGAGGSGAAGDGGVGGGGGGGGHGAGGTAAQLWRRWAGGDPSKREGLLPAVAVVDSRARKKP